MLNFSFFDKYKKTIIFAVLLAVILGTIFAFVITPPRSVIATEGFIIPADSPEAEQIATDISGIPVGSGTVGGSGLSTAEAVAIAVCGASIVLGFFTLGIAWTASLIACAGTIIYAGLDSWGIELFKAILKGLGDLMYDISNVLANYSTGWLKAFLSSGMMTEPILTQFGFSTGWGQVRDFANMFIVLGFVVIGIAFALRIGEYGSKKVLINLVIVALLVNFSGLFCGLIIDGTNLVTAHFLRAGGGDVGATMYGQLDCAGRQVGTQVGNRTCGVQNWEQMARKDMRQYLVAELFYIVSFMLIAIAYFYLVIILAARQAIFGILFVLSPLAFFCWVFPATKHLWTKWWETFIKWGFIGAQIAFFCWVGSMIVSGIQETPNTSVVLVYISVLVLLFVAVKTARGAANEVAGGVMGLAKGAAGFALGAGLGVAKIAGKGLDSLSGGRISRAGKAISSGTGRALERMGLRPQGTTAMSMQKSMEDSSSRVGKMTEADKTRVAASSSWASGAARKDKLAAIQDKIKNNNLSDLGDTAAQHKAIEWAEREARSRGIDTSSLRKDAEKQNYHLATFNQKKLSDYKKAHPLPGGAALPPGEAERAVAMTQLKENLPKMSGGDIRKIDISHLSAATHPDNYNFIRENFTARTIDQFQTSNDPLKIAAVKAHEATIRAELATGTIKGSEANRLKKLADAMARLK